MKLSENKENIELSVNVRELLPLIPNRDLIEYVERNLDMIHIDDVDEHCECEEIRIYDFDDYELIDEMGRRGYTVYDANPKGQSIVRELAMNKILETINSMSDTELNAIANKLI